MYAVLTSNACCLSGSVNAQKQASHSFFNKEPAHALYGTREGLEHPFAYTVFHDSKGRTWVGTNAGPAWIIDHRIQPLRKQYKLPYEHIGTVFYMHEDEYGRVWLADSRNQIYYFEHDQFHPYIYQDTLKKYQPKRYFRGLRVYNNEVYVSYPARRVKRIDANGIWHDQLVPLDTGEILSVEVYCLPTGCIGSSTRAKNTGDRDYQQIEFLVTQDDVTTRITSTVVPDPSSWYTTFAKKRQDTLFVSAGNALYAVVQDTVVAARVFPKTIEGIVFDKYDRLWVSTSNALLILDPETLNVLHRWFENEDHWFILKENVTDYEGGIWLSSLGKGILYIPDLRITEYEAERLNLLSTTGLTSGPEYMYVGISKNEVLRISTTGDTVSIQVPKPEPATNRMPSAIHFSGATNRLWHSAAENRLVEMDSSGGFLAEYDAPQIRRITESPDGTIWFASSYSLRKRTPSGTFSHILPTKHELRISDITAPHADTLWITSPEGLFSYCDTGWHHHTGLHPAFGKSSTSIASLPNGTLCIGIDKEGPLVFKSGKLTTPAINDSIGGYKFVEVLDSSSFIFQNQFGLHRIRTEPELQVDRICGYYGVSQGRVYHGTSFAGNWWTSGRNGIISYDLSLFDEVEEPDIRLLIEEVRVNNVRTSLATGDSLSYDQDRLQFRFQGYSGKHPGRLQYRYRLLGLDSTWTETEINEIQFTSLPPGDYGFEVEVQNLDGSWSSHRQAIAFYLIPAIWQQVWFQALGALMIAIALVGLFQWRVRQIRKSNEVRMQALRYQQSSLAAQINPHFLYNAMNSIQRFVLKNEKQQAYTYLERFGGLIRNVLDHSSSDLITLQEEVNTLEEYLELESVRLQHAFSYKIVVDDTVDAAFVRLPPMLIQPYVENAIWHGFHKLDRPGLVAISFIETNDHLICEVEDNGVGRESEHPRTQKTRLHKPHGMQATRERLALLSRMHKSRFSVDIVDLKTKDGRAAGTRVCLQIPLL